MSARAARRRTPAGVRVIASAAAPNAAPKPARAAKLGLEHPDIVRFPPVLRASVEQALADERAARPGEARRRYQALLDGLPHRGRAHLAACLTRWIGRTFMQEGALETAEEHFELSLAIAERCGEERPIAMAKNLLAIAAQLTGRLEEAERRYREVVRLAATAGELQLVAMAEQNLGALMTTQGRLEEGVRHCRRAIRRYRALGLEDKAALALNNLGMVYADLERWDDARRAYRLALQGCRRLGDRATAFSIRINLAETYVGAGRLERALDLCLRVIACAEREEVGAAQWAGEAYKHAGVVHRERGEMERAAWCLEQASCIAAGRNDVLLGAETAREQAELLARQGRNREALEMLNRAHARFADLRAARDQARMAQRLAEFEQRFTEIVRRWGVSLETRDAYTQGHCERVADHATRLAAACGFPEQTLFWFRIGALLHDIGKLHVPLGVLNKAGPLTEEERAMIERHPAAGEAMLAHIEFPWDVRPMIRGHHERWDGRGYPDALAGEQIPLTARILAVADVWDALTTARSYRPAYSAEEAVAIMRRESGSTFDPVLLERFLEIVRAEEKARGARVA
ncbi:MAG: HD domain-containing phosphohydrolase [Gemmatimonadaceae bacterium]